MINEKKLIDGAKKIGCELKYIKAVRDVESSGVGFRPSGFPTILFEPHIFWKELRKLGITPTVSDICYPKWGTKPYANKADQQIILERAVKINREAALKSCSWGLFQIMGFNYKLCGCKTLQDFVNLMRKSEDDQFDLFVNYIINSYLDDELKNGDLDSFSRQYNGPLYIKNGYPTKLKKALAKYE